MGKFSFLISFLISIILGLFSIFRLLKMVSLKEVIYLSFIKMLFIFIIVFIFGLVLEVFIKMQFRKKKRLNLVLPEEKP